MSDWNGFAKIIFNVVYIFDKCYWNTKKKSKQNQKREKKQKQNIEKQKEYSNWKAKIENHKRVCMLTGRVVDHICTEFNFCIIKVLNKLYNVW